MVGGNDYVTVGRYVFLTFYSESVIVASGGKFDKRPKNCVCKIEFLYFVFHVTKVQKIYKTRVFFYHLYA